MNTVDHNNVVIFDDSLQVNDSSDLGKVGKGVAGHGSSSG